MKSAEHDEQVRRIALFFLFSLMDEKVALQAAHKTIAGLKAAGEAVSGSVTHDFTSTSGSSSATSAITIIAALRKMHDQHRKLVPRNRPLMIPNSAWSLPENVDAEAWIKFQKDSADTEIVAVVLSKILSYSDQDIAEGLNVSLGTARYRIGKGVRQLGMSKVRNET
jgi:hypothetical protein